MTSRELYLCLLRGEIPSKVYVDALKREAKARRITWEMERQFPKVKP